MSNTNIITGHAAIDYARSSGVVLNKYADPCESAREDLSIEAAEAVAAQDPSLIWVEVEEALVGDIVAGGCRGTDDDSEGRVR